MEIIDLCYKKTKQEYFKIIKTSMRDGKRYKSVHSEISHGGYVTSDDEVAFTNYLVHLLSHNYVIVKIDVEEELNERLNGGDSDDDGDNAR